VRGDADKLRQVFANLISNGLKFTNKGGMVTLEAQRLSDDGVAVRISDTGIGMTEEEIGIALSPFGQVDASSTRWRDGTGLGLPIAKALVELHGGSLDIASIKNRGTEVTIILPPAHTVSSSQSRETAHAPDTNTFI
jgi:two-component system cell cycle sensor histidine kinase PleC